MSDRLEDLMAHRLDALAEAMTVPLEARRPYLALVQMFGHRSVDFRRAIYREVAASSEAAAMVILRSMADLLILVHWIELCPKLHVALWSMESERKALEHRDDMIELLAQRRQPVPDGLIPTIEYRRRVARRVERYRALARASGLRIRREIGDSILPSVRERVRALPLSEVEMYDVAFGYNSSWAHSSGLAFQLEFVEGSDGIHARAADQFQPEAILRYAVTLQAGTCAAVSRMLGLGIEDQLDMIRVGAVGLPGTGDQP